MEQAQPLLLGEQEDEGDLVEMVYKIMRGIHRVDARSHLPRVRELGTKGM